MGGQAEDKTRERICVGLLAHVDAGKTTLSEALLYLTGSIRKMGRVDNQDAFLDTYALERARGITIFSKQAGIEWKGMSITLLDTPGHVDFSAEMERTLQEKRDAEHFLRVLAPKFKSVFVVDLKTDRMRGVIVPDYFQKILDTSGGSFLAVLQQDRDTQVQPAYRESLADLLDYNYIRSKVLTGDIVEHTYKKTDGTTFRVKVTPYSRSGSHIDETLWIFSDEGASLTPPQTK